MGGLRRDPEVTGEQVEAVMPGCNDTGGEQPPDETVSAGVLRGIDPGTALLWDDTVFVREGRRLPAWIRRWRTPPTCATPGTFTLGGG